MIAFALVGSMFVILSWVVGGSEVFWPSFYIEVGVTLFLFGFLFFVEQRLEGSVERGVGDVRESIAADIGVLRDEVGAVRADVDGWQATIESLEKTLGEKYERSVAADDITRGEPISAAKTDPTFANIKSMLMAAKSNNWILGSGVRVALPRQHRLYMKFVPPEKNELFVTVRFEEPSQIAVLTWRWLQEVETEDFFVDALRRLEELHRGSFPRQDFDPPTLTAWLVRTIEIGYMSAIGRPGLTAGITELVEMPNEDFVITGRELCCLYNEYRVDSATLRSSDRPVNVGDFKWRSESNLFTAWTAATELLAPS